MAAKITKEHIEEIKSASSKYRMACQQNMGVNSARERFRNILQTYAHEIMTALDELEDLREENQMLQDALDKADAENDKLRAAKGGKKAANGG